MIPCPRPGTRALEHTVLTVPLPIALADVTAALARVETSTEPPSEWAPT